MSSTPPLANLALPVTDEALAARLQQRLDTIEELLAGYVQGRTKYVSEAAAHLMSAGGKRFRPLLVLLAAETGPEPGCEEVLTAAGRPRKRAGTNSQHSTIQSQRRPSIGSYSHLTVQKNCFKKN